MVHERKTEQIHLRVDEGILAAIDALPEAAGNTRRRPAAIRNVLRRALVGARPIVVDKDALAALVVELRAAGSNLNQLVRQTYLREVNRSYPWGELEKTTAAVSGLLDKTRRLLASLE